MIQDEETKGGLALQDYVDALRRRKLQLIVPLVVIPAVALVLSVPGLPAHQASAQALLNQVNVTDTVTGIQAPYVDPGRVAQTEAQLARVPEVARQVIASVSGHGLTEADFLDSSSAAVGLGSDLMTFSVTHSDPEMAKRLATAYARVFTRYRHGLNTQEFDRARDALKLQIDELEAAGLGGSALHKSLSQKERQLAALAALRPPTTVVVREADTTTNVGARALVRNVLLGIALGLVFGLVAAFVAEALDSRVHSLAAIRSKLGLPLLGSIPPPGRALREEGGLVVLQAPMSPEAEAFRVVRTNLDLANAAGDGRTIMLTSGVQGEGKSTTISNLAVTLARAGRHVVLIDLDLRNPSLHKLFGFQPQQGLVDVPLYDDTVAAGPWPRSASTSEEGAHEGRLQILPAMNFPAGPDEFGPDSTTARILQSSRDHADVVLVDSAPLLTVSDAIALSAYVDAILLVVRLNMLRSSAIDDVRRILSSSPAAKLGFVLTGAAPGEVYMERQATPSRFRFRRPRPERAPADIQVLPNPPSAQVASSRPRDG